MSQDKPYQFASAEVKHQATLKVLAEALEYLERLPQVPVTTDFCKKLRSHLDDPSQTLVMGMQDTFRGERVSPSGVTYATAELRGGKLIVSALRTLPPPMDRVLSQEEYERRLLNSLFKGMPFDLRNEGAQVPQSNDGPKSTD